MPKLCGIQVESVSDVAMTSGGEHAVIWFRGADAQDLGLRLSVHHLATLIEVCARALTDAARNGHDIESKLLDSRGRFRVGFWNRFPDANGSTNLALTLETGGVLAFEIPADMAESLFGPAERHQRMAPCGFTQ